MYLFVIFYCKKEWLCYIESVFSIWDMLFIWYLFIFNSSTEDKYLKGAIWMNEILELQKLEDAEEMDMGKGKGWSITLLGGSTLSVQC